MVLEIIREWLVLDESSPSGLSWARNGNRGGWVQKGRPALICINNHGYYAGSLQGKQLKAHRAVFALAHGYLPAGDIDHIDGNRSNNSPNNLRLVTRNENQHNRRGAKGCYYNKRDKVWYARIMVNGSRHELGAFKAERDALAAYLKAKKVYHPTVPINYE